MTSKAKLEMIAQLLPGSFLRYAPLDYELMCKKFSYIKAIILKKSHRKATWR